MGEKCPRCFDEISDTFEHSTVAVHAAPLALAAPLAPPLLRDLEEAQVFAAVPVQGADGRRVVVRLPSGDTDPIIDEFRGEFLPEHVDQLAFVNGDCHSSAQNDGVQSDEC